MTTASQVFEVVGATASTSICYVLPGLFTYRLFGHDSAAYKWAGLAFAGLGVVLTTVSLAVIFIKDD
jgi:amino acid permease